jgi:hypothetical protein
MTLARLARRSEHPDRKRGRRVNLSILADSTLAECIMEQGDGAVPAWWSISQAVVAGGS